MKSKAQVKANRKYDAKAYERAGINFPGGSRESYQAQAANHGYKSLPAYIMALMDADATPDELAARNEKIAAHRQAVGLPPRPVPGQTAPETTPPESPED